MKLSLFLLLATGLAYAKDPLLLETEPLQTISQQSLKQQLQDAPVVLDNDSAGKAINEKENTQDAQAVSLATVTDADNDEAELVNKIVVIIYVTAPSQPGSDKELEKVSDIVITLLDTERPTIDGRMRTLDELILDRLIEFEAVYFYRMVVPDEAIDKYIASIREHYSLSEEQLVSMFKQAGYTYDEGREQLRAAQAVDSLINFKIRSRLVVPEKDIRDYYDAHPVYEQASYKIKKAFIPDDVLTKDQLENFNDLVAKKKEIEWSSAYWLVSDEITDQRRAMLEALAVGQYGKPEQVTGGYEVIKLVAAKPRALRSFEDSYREITMKLQEPQYHKMFDAFKKELFAKYEVVYL